jgi:cytosine/adenosine deaminase-related metal-dependent hydrolase
MKLASILHKRKTPEDISEQEILDMATINGAKALGLEEEIGSIEIGKKADLITIDLHRPEMRPIHGKRGLISNLVYSFSGKVDDLLVDGEVLMRDGVLMEKNPGLMSEVDRVSEKI